MREILKEWTLIPMEFILRREKPLPVARAVVGLLILGWLWCIGGYWVAVVVTPFIAVVAFGGNAISDGLKNSHTFGTGLLAVPFSVVSIVAFMALSFLAAGGFFSLLEIVTTRGFWREILALVCTVFIQFILLVPHPITKWRLTLARIVGTSVWAYLTFFIFHLISDSFLSDSTVLQIESVASDILERFRYPFGKHHPSLTTTYIFVFLFLLATVLDLLLPSLKTLSRTKRLNSALSALKTFVLAFACFTLSASQAEQMGLRAEGPRVTDLLVRARVAKELTADIDKMTFLQRKTLYGNLERIRQGRHSKEVLEDVLEYVGRSSRSGGEQLQANAPSHDSAKRSPMRQAVSDRLEAEQDLVTAKEGLARTLQTLTDDVNESALTAIAGSESEIVELLISAIVEVASDKIFEAETTLAEQTVRYFADPGDQPSIRLIKPSDEITMTQRKVDFEHDERPPRGLDIKDPYRPKERAHPVEPVHPVR